MSTVTQTPIDARREELRSEIIRAVGTAGVWTTDTCPTGAAFGWDMPKHYALEQLYRRGIEGITLRYIYRHECYEWTATAT